MVHIIRDRLRQMIAVERITPDEVKASRPVLGWEARYSRPEWTTAMFIDAVYDEFAASGTR